MRFLVTALILSILYCGLAAADVGPIVVYSFESGRLPQIGQWMIHGQPSLSPSRDVDDGNGVLKIDYKFGFSGIDHIVFSLPLAGDLGVADKVTFRMKGDGKGTHIYLYLMDDNGVIAAYGPHSGKADFNTSSTEWKTYTVDLVNDNSISGRVDQFKTHSVGIMLNDNGKPEPYEETLLFDDFTLVPGKARMSISCRYISPNGDGTRDEVRVLLNRAGSYTATVKDSKGKKVSTVACESSIGGSSGVWKGLDDSGKLLPPGAYMIEVDIDGTILGSTLNLEDRLSLVEGQPEEGFFPIGAWYEGAPGDGYSGCPVDVEGAARYYEKTFADLKTHNINTLAIPNAPATHRDLILKTAEKHDIKIVLEVGELVGIVSSPEDRSEADVYNTAKTVTDKLKNYPALLRYQIRDEPSPQMASNWIMVKRMLQSLDPKHPAFSCFCTLDSLTAIAQGTRLNEVVFDHYPVGNGTLPGHIGGFNSVVDTVCKIAKDRPVWMVLQVHGSKTPQWFGLRTPEPAELRRMTYLSLMKNSKGIFYFIYQTEQGWDGMVDKELKPLPIFREVGKLSGELKKLAPTLLTISPIQAFAKSSEGSSSACFKDKNGGRYIVVVNDDVLASKSISLELDKPDGCLSDVLTKSRYTVSGGKAVISLSPGDGAVLRVERQ